MDPITPGVERGAAMPALRNYTADELKEAVLAKLTYSVGKNSVAASPRDWFLAVAFATRDIVVERWIASTAAAYADGRKRVYYLSLEFLIGRLLYDAMTNLGIVEPMTRGAVAARRSTWRPAAHRVRRGARQRRPRPPRRLLHGQHGDAVDRRLRLRHPLRQRPVPPDHPRRLAAGDARGLARPRQPVGVRAPGSQLRGRLRRLGGGGAGRRGERPPRLAPERDHRGDRLRHADRRLARAPRQHAAAVVGARRRPAEARRLQRRRLPRRRIRPRARRGDLQGALSQRRHPGRPGAAAAAGVFLRLAPRCSTWCAATSSSSATSARLADHAAVQLNDTHPVDRRRRADAHPRRHEPASSGRKRGRSPRRCSPTPTTRCCPRRWRAGRCR